MVRSAKSPRPSKPKYLYEVRISHAGQWDARQDDLWAVVARIADVAGFKRKEPFWSYTAVYFDTQRKADELRRWMSDCRFEHTPDHRKWVDPYDDVVKRQHAIIWGLSSGVLDKVVHAYRRQRATCTTHGGPNWEASSVILDAAPTIKREVARDMVDAMLAWVIARDSSWFWSDLDGPHIINRY